MTGPGRIGLALVCALVGHGSASTAERAVPAAGAPIAPAAPPLAEGAPRALVFAPAPGTKLVRHAEVAHQLLLTSMTARSPRAAPQRSTPDLAIDSKLELDLEDELLSVAGGRPERLRRVLAKGLYHVELGPRAAAKKTAYDVRSPLETASVVYTWVPEESDWGRYYDAKEFVEELLAGLRQDVDFLALLPGRPVRDGDTWSVPAARLVDVFAPCGRLPYAWPKELDRAMVRTLSSGIGGGLDEVFGGASKGEAKATLARVETRAGAELAIVTLAIDVELERDQGDVLRQKGSLDDKEGAAPTVGAHVRWSFQGTGELAWNLSAGRAESLRIDGQQKLFASVQLDRAGTMAQELELAGKLSVLYGVR